jgi:hypothetical protein
MSFSFKKQRARFLVQVPELMIEIQKTTGRAMENDEMNTNLYILCRQTKLDPYTALCKYYEYDQELIPTIVAVLVERDREEN